MLISITFGLVVAVIGLGIVSFNLWLKIKHLECLTACIVASFSKGDRDKIVRAVHGMLYEGVPPERVPPIPEIHE